MPTDCKRWVVLTGVIVAYFISFPGDLSAVFEPFREALSLTNAISPWLYVVVAAAIVAWAIVRCFGHPREITAR